MLNGGYLTLNSYRKHVQSFADINLIIHKTAKYISCDTYKIQTHRPLSISIEYDIKKTQILFA